MRVRMDSGQNNLKRKFTKLVESKQYLRALSKHVKISQALEKRSFTPHV